MGEIIFSVEHQTLQPFVDIGDNVVPRSASHIGHHSTIGDHCFVTLHVVIYGHCKIKSYIFSAFNSMIADNFIMGNCFIPTVESKLLN